MLVSGSIVCEYVGNPVSRSDGLESLCKQQSMGSSHYYVFFFNHKGVNMCIDATGIYIQITLLFILSVFCFLDPSPSFGRIINHSTKPNCVPIVFEDDNNCVRLLFQAYKKIDLDEEITYNYDVNYPPLF